MNYYGFYTLFKKEVLRFWKVGIQTLLAPIVTALLYLLVFSNAIQNKTPIAQEISYMQFLIPGLIMMSMLQNTFANVSSSLIQSKVSGNIIFILLPPISNLSFFNAFIGAAILRGFLIGIGIFFCTIYLGDATYPKNILWVFLFALIGCTSLATLGLIAGLLAEKFEQTSTFQNFIIMPLTFLAGVFYSIKNLPDFWYRISQYNPFFYLVDGFRYGFFKQSDIDPLTSFYIAGLFLIILIAIAMYLLKTGYKIKQ